MSETGLKQSKRCWVKRYVEIGRRKRERERDRGKNGKIGKQKQYYFTKGDPIGIGNCFSENMPPQNHIVDRHCFVTQIVLVMHSMSKQEPF